MKSTEAIGLLSRLLGWEPERVSDEVLGRLAVLARYKYDRYGGYEPGMRFLEALLVFLDQFEPEDREVAFSLITHLIFVSEAEFSTLIKQSFPDQIGAVLVEQTAAELGIPAWRLAKVLASTNYRELKRRMLILGLSDGARLDRLRRSANLSNEQVVLSTSIDPAAGKRLASKLAQEIGRPATYWAAVFVDDFSASGNTLLRQAEGQWAGKLARAAKGLEDLRTLGLFEEPGTLQIVVLLYIATQKALRHVQDECREHGGWLSTAKVCSVMRLSDQHRITRESSRGLVDLCTKYYDSSIEDEHTETGGTTMELGYAGGGWPLVLAHNTPNNSVALLHYQSNREDYERHRMRALFPRYRRHTSG